MNTIGKINEFNIVSTTHFLHMGIMEKVQENTILIDDIEKTILIHPDTEERFINEAKISRETVQETIYHFMNKYYGWDGK